MAHSGLEPRLPLLVGEGLWQPWGPLGIPSYKFQEMGTAPCRRSKSWSGYKVHESAAGIRAREVPELLEGGAAAAGCGGAKGVPRGAEGPSAGAGSPTSSEGTEFMPRGQRGGCSSSEVTTFVVNNLPFKLTVQDLLVKLADCGFEGDIDFAYLPFNLKSRRNHGSAFINFTSREAAQRFQLKWHNKALGFKQWFTTPNRRRHIDLLPNLKLRVRPAKVQGISACTAMVGAKNFERVRSPCCKPWLLSQDACPRAD